MPITGDTVPSSALEGINPKEDTPAGCNSRNSLDWRKRPPRDASHATVLTGGRHEGAENCL
ncbi:hypothetical protein Pyn_41157 [Prunus yedoensis var. nudiflora]|uniref:Uncharacterized protein n=1 Tax=Prunus yedoensis var. nudiflora TaxID=2094558 RepID=A0A314Y6I9_PRUYE|nr:hypothetical protein Pyn_41157 [Prunus yedoensis var. nudiflora]